ncbi:MAG: hypothetical protein RTU63_14905 [Candidatus Thorarchaeota archaeon]
MISRRTLIVTVAVGLLLLGAAPRSVSADITGNIYTFSAVWFNQTYQVDNAIVLDETAQGSFLIDVYNITSSDSYEYAFTGLNYHPYGFSPYYDDYNGSVAFQDNKVHFDLDTTDVDEDDLVEDYDLDMYPYFSEHHPGSMFFVNPVWSTHTTDWTTSVGEAETQLGVTSFTDGANEGSFSFNIVMGIEYNHSVYNYMSGTTTISFSAVYDTDGVLSSWSLQYLTSSSNENHTVVHTQNQSFSRGAGIGASDPTLGSTLAVIGAVGIGGLIVGVIIGKKFLS